MTSLQQSPTRFLQAFITATDTNVGKTFFTSLLLRAAKEKGWRPFALKPLCTGGEEDIKILLSELPSPFRKEDICYASYPHPAAPAVAAELSGKTISKEDLLDWCRQKLTQNPVCFIEGAGGWLVPIVQNWCIADLAAELNLPVLLIVPDRLGCVNHTALTAYHMNTRGVRLAGVILNQLPGQQPLAAGSNADLLRKAFSLPVLGSLPTDSQFLPSPLEEAIWQALQAAQALS
ncbi:MAG: dethiobiotin synthase [Chthoniobacterales bacterium]|nr:dethiobiotin synthase [Chthoniobacterales bacterium]